MTADELQAYVLANYRTMKLKEMAAHVGVHWSRIQTQADRLITAGLLSRHERAYQRPWTEEEDEYLAERWGRISDIKVAAHINRTITACQIRVKRHLGINRHTQFYTQREVAHVFGIDEHKIGMLREAKLLDGKPAPFFFGLNRVWRFEEKQIEAFIRKYPWHYDRSRIEEGTYFRRIADNVQDADPWLTTQEFAELAGVTRNCVSANIRGGRLQAQKTWGASSQGDWRIPQSELTGFRPSTRRRRRWRV